MGKTTKSLPFKAVPHAALQFNKGLQEQAKKVDRIPERNNTLIDAIKFTLSDEARQVIDKMYPDTLGLKVGDVLDTLHAVTSEDETKDATMLIISELAGAAQQCSKMGYVDADELPEFSEVQQELISKLGALEYYRDLIRQDNGIAKNSVTGLEFLTTFFVTAFGAIFGPFGVIFGITLTGASSKGTLGQYKSEVKRLEKEVRNLIAQLSESDRAKAEAVQENEAGNGFSSRDSFGFEPQCG